MRQDVTGFFTMLQGDRGAGWGGDSSTARSVRGFGPGRGVGIWARARGGVGIRAGARGGNYLG